MKRILIGLLVLALVVPVVLTSAPAAAQGDDVTLRWRTRPDNQAEIDVYQSVSDSLDAEWDGVALQYEPGGSETASYQDVLITEITAGTAPDVFWIPGTDIARFAKLGLIMNLADMAAADEMYNEADFYPQQMEQLTYSMDENAALWGLPRDASAFAIFFNKDLFDEAGLDYPTDVESWNWDTFYTAASEISSLSDEIKGFGMNAWWANWGYWVNAAGSSFFNEDRTACGMDNDATVVGMEFSAKLFQEGLAVPYGEDSEPPFLAGNVGMFINGRWATPGTVANADFAWDVVALPEGPGGASNWLFWGAYVVNAETEHPEEAWELAMKLTSTEVQGQIAALGANIPSRAYSDPAAAEAFLATFDGEINNQAFLDGLLVGVAEAPLWNGDWSEIDRVYGSEVSKVYAGELSPEDFAATICDMVSPYFDAAE